MKNLSLLFTILCTTIIGHAAILTVDNNINSPAQYSTIQTAVDAANDGDTIHIVGSPTLYATATITKELHLVGDGHNSNKQNPSVSRVNTIMLRTTAFTTSSGSTFEGLELNNLNIQGAYYAISDTVYIDSVTIQFCKINSTLYFYKYISTIQVNNNIINSITNSVIYYSYDGLNNIVINNNIIRYNNYKGSSFHYTTFSNNNFISSVNTSSASKKINFNNNIFYGISPNHTTTGHDGNIYTNNLSYFTSNNVFDTIFPNSGAGNFTGIDPQFVSKPTLTPFVTTDDYNLQSGSAAINAGSDGTDIGITGGLNPWPEDGASLSGYMYGREASVPQVNEINIQNPNVPSNGNLIIQVKGQSNQ